MKRYSLFHPLWLAFYSQNLYRYVKDYWRGNGFVYVFMVLTLCWSIVALVWVFTLETVIPGEEIFEDGYRPANKQQSQLIHLVNQFPSLHLKSGVLSWDESQELQLPYSIKDYDSGETLVMIDFSGDLESVSSMDAKTVLTPNRAFVRSSNGNYIVYEMKELVGIVGLDNQNITINSQFLKDFMLTLKERIRFFFILLLVVSFGFTIIKMYIFGGIALLLAKIIGVELRYSQAIRLASVAATPGIIATSLILWLPWLVTIPISRGAFFMLNMAYLFFAVWSNRQHATPQMQNRQ